MSLRETALSVLFEMLTTGDYKDRINAAGKILKSTNVAEEHTMRAVAVLKEIMNDERADPRDRTNAAGMLKDYSPKPQTARDQMRVLAMMTDTELQTIVDQHELDGEIHPMLR
jgi:hypothetical protein